MSILDFIFGKKKPPELPALITGNPKADYTAHFEYFTDDSGYWSARIYWYAPKSGMAEELAGTAKDKASAVIEARESLAKAMQKYRRNS